MSIKKNFLYSSILTSAGYIFPLITFPYVSRVLGVANIGICSFVDSIINYFVLFSMLGIQTIGIREVARSRSDKTELCKVFYSIIALNLVFVSICSIALFISIQVIPSFAEHKTLMYIGLVKLLTTFALIEWFFNGMENFRFITIRSIVIRCLYVFSVFIFIREKNDYPIYFALTTLSQVINALVNCLYARKFLTFSIKGLRPFHYLKSSLVLGSYSVLTSMYTSFNMAYLGFVTDKIEVGYYATALKLQTIILAIFTAFTNVMLPRMSSLLAEGKSEEFRSKIQKSFSLLIYLSFPIMIFCSFFSTEIITLISGAEYEKAAIPLTIMLPLVFVIGFEQILVKQILTPLKKDTSIFINSVIGALVGIVLNIILVKELGCIGSSIVWLISEISVMVSAIIFVKTSFSLKGTTNMLCKNFLYAIPPLAFCIILRLLSSNQIIQILIAICFIIVYYVFIHLLVIKDEMMMSILPKKLIVILQKTQRKSYE